MAVPKRKHSQARRDKRRSNVWKLDAPAPVSYTHLDVYKRQLLTRSNLRSNFGMVLQDTWLFEGTIAENIAYGRPNATREEIIAAAKAARVDFFVRTMPHGYDTVLSNDAENISIGQRQLLTIARVFLADPAVLILDEATSSVDTRTEIEIGKAMRKLMKNRTSFVIAHRLSTIVDADLILLMPVSYTHLDVYKRQELNTALNQLYKKQDDLYHEYAAHFGLSDTAFWILYSLCETEDTYTQNMLADMWHLPKQSINSSVSTLVKAGYIKLEQMAVARNNKALRLTPQGMQFCQRDVYKRQVICHGDPGFRINSP